MAPDPPTCSSKVTTQRTTKTPECLEPWLDDGNIVLVVQEKSFRVHRTILGSYSEVFRDMFSIPHSDAIEEETIGGCPVIHLQDSVDDVQIMLKALYDRGFVFCYSAPMPASVLAAFLRMGKKYAVRQLLEEAKKRLSLDSPPLLCASKMSAAGGTTLFPRVSENDPFNFTVMNAAAEAGLFSAVVLALFYCCLACPAASIANGYDFEGEKVTLSLLNARYCIIGQRYLLDVERRMIQVFAYHPKTCEQRSARRGSCSFTALLNLRQFQALQCPFSQWQPDWDDGLCSVCRAELRKKHEDLRLKLWKRFPVTLGLGPWEELDNETEIIDS